MAPVGPRRSTGRRAGPGPRGARSRPGTARAARRPAAHPTGPAAAGPPPHAGRRTTYTTRAAVLALVVCALAVTLAVPARLYFAQRSKIAQTAQQTQAQQARVNALQKAAKAAADPKTVEQEARERLHFALPGEQLLLVPPKATTPGAGAPAPGVAHVQAGGPWYSKLWTSAATAAKPAAR